MPYLEANAALDLRRGRRNKPDPINPRSGFYAAANVQAAWIFPEAGWDIRIKPELRAYTAIAGDVTLALRVGGGLLFNFGYGERLLDVEASCAPGALACDTNPCDDIVCAPGDASCLVTRLQCEDTRARSLQITQLRGFYSGGLDTNRGYGRNGVNPQEEVLSLFQGSQGAGVAQLSPIGGPLALGGVSSSFASRSTRASAAPCSWTPATPGTDALAFRPHLSAGLGLRYATPIGPLRVDVGVRIPCAQEIGVDLRRAPGGPRRPSQVARTTGQRVDRDWANPF
jgi:hypothetical protein